MATPRDHGNKLSVVVDILMRDFSGDASLVGEIYFIPYLFTQSKFYPSPKD